MRLQPSFSDRVRYILQHGQTGSLTIPEPIGWRADDNEFVRSKTLHGVMTQMTNNLQFTNEGREYINSVRNTYGINAILRMVKDERHPITDVWTRAYDGFLDLSTWSESDNKVSVKFDSSGLLKLIKSRETEKIELDRLDTIDGEILTALNKETVALNGRDIFLKSRLETAPINSATNIWKINSDTGNSRYGVLAIPLTEDYGSNIGVISVFPNSFSEELGATASVDSSKLFFADSSINTSMTVTIKGSLTIDVFRSWDFVSDAEASIRLVKYNNSTDYDFLEVIDVLDNIYPLGNGETINVSVDYESTLNLLEGESLSLQVYGKAKIGFAGINNSELRFDITNIDFTVNIDENSFFEPTQSQFFLPHEIGNRLINIISDRDDAFYSEVLGRTDIGYDEDGEAALIGATNGFQIRGFEPTDERYKSFTTTWKDFTTSYLNVWNLGMGIEKIGFQERVRIEPLSYFYNRNILIRIGSLDENGVFQYTQVNNVKRNISVAHYYSGLEFGYDKVTDYEEANGLDEYNLSNTYTTIINRLEKKYSKKSKYRADSYGMEFARRKPFKTSPTEDTKYDNSNFLIDLKRGVTDIFEQRLWADDFEQEPTGVFSPETATNLRLSPFNMLLRHGWLFGAGLTKYPNDFIRYGSSVANSNLKTKLIGGVEYEENGNIQNQKLDKPRFVPEIIEFEHEVSFDLLQQVQGKTVILGKEIQNFYGLVAFKNEKGQIEKGFLQNLKPNGSGRWKLIKYNN